jgi:hypothetical protein
MWEFETTGQNFNYFWTEWLKERYDSIANAEANLSHSFSTDTKGNIKSPTEDQLCKDNHLKLSAAYKRFYDDWVSKEFTKAANIIREIDPHHLITAKAGWGATYEKGCKQNPVEARALAPAVDFLGIEGYLHEDADVKAEAGFIARHAAYLMKKPIVFMEWGFHRSLGETKQEQYFREMYEATQEYGVAGSFPWFYASEANDYGIIDYPSMRETAAVSVIREMSSELKSPQPPVDINSWIVYDQDALGNRAQNKMNKVQEFRTHLDLGAKPTVISPCVNTTSKTPHNSYWSGSDVNMCVGNAPYDWHCPLKCVNAQFNYLKIQDANGKWVNAQDNSVIEVKENQPVYIQFSIANIGEAKWLTESSAEGAEGSVGLGNPKMDPYFGIKLDKNKKYLSNWEVSSEKISNGFSGTKTMDFALFSGNIAWFGERIQNVSLVAVSGD